MLCAWIGEASASTRLISSLPSSTPVLGGLNGKPLFIAADQGLERTLTIEKASFFEMEVHLVSLTGTRPIQRTEARNLSYEKDPTEHGGNPLPWQGKHQRFFLFTVSQVEDY